MKTSIILFIITFLITVQACLGQNEPIKDFRNFPLVLSIQFHSLAMPFKDLKSNLKNIGFGIGTEVSHTGSHDWFQQFDVIWIKNKGIGNALFFSTQTVWRPQIIGGFSPEVKAGLGYMLATHPSPPMVQKDGNWIESKKKKKGMLTVPVGIGLGYYSYSPNMFVSPFVGYQMLLVTNYNKTIPVVPQTLLQTGIRIHPNYKELAPH